MKTPETIIASLSTENHSLWAAICKHTRQFCWTRCTYFRGDPIRPIDVVVRMQNLFQRNAVRKEPEEKYPMHSAFIMALDRYQQMDDGNGNGARRYLRLVTQLSNLRSARLSAFFIGNCSARSIFEELARRLGITYDDLVFLTTEEILRGLRTGLQIDRSEIGERKGGFGVYVSGDLAKWDFSNNKTQRRANDHHPQVRNILRGIGTYPGRASGRAKIILDPAQMCSVPEGCVLVTTMTVPSLIGALEQASAVVTDEGGTLCHAAIISRELRIPCVVGTGDATLCLKENDVVEVNASSGIVKKLSRINNTYSNSKRQRQSTRRVTYVSS